MIPDKYVRGLVALIFFISVFNSFFYVNSYANSSVLPKFYVDDTYDNSTPGWQVDHFDSIQDAIDSPDCGSGDRVVVYSGTYYENLIVNKSIDLFGEDRDTTIIDGSSSGDVITVSSSGVDISTFTIKRSGSGLIDAGVKLDSGSCRIVDNIIQNCKNAVFVNNTNSNTISYNSITSNTHGVFVNGSDSNTISYNTIYSNSGNGVFINDTCDLNAISNNVVYSNSKNGVYLFDHCTNNTISGNTIYSNSQIGVRIENSSNNRINQNNSIYSNTLYGVLVVGADNLVDGNLIYSNTKHGVFLLADNNTIVRNNSIYSNTKDGIRMQNSTNDVITGNNVSSNSRYGVYVNYYSISGSIYNNSFYQNTYNAYDISNGVNSWNISETVCRNIINGPNVGGNYWSDYTGSDSDGDGMGDSNYAIDGGDSVDYLPLMHRRPTADTGGPYTGSTGESITFDGTDSVSLDGSIISWSWDFGDGTTGTGYRKAHTYSESGTYTVTLTIRNDLGSSATDTTTCTISPDTTAPVIEIYQKGTSTSGLSNVFVFSANVTDNVGLNKVWIEYWYPGSDHLTAFMQNTQGVIYKKVITAQGEPEKVFCIIYANDTSENQADSKDPYSDPGGSYTNHKVLENIEFDGSGSYDLDGNLTEYLWDFGDGATATAVSPVHMFHTDGTYTVSLTVTDDDENTHKNTVSVVISPLIEIVVSNATKSIIETEYSINLSERFSAYDTDADDHVDTFIDPNNIMYVLNTGFINISSSECFLLSVNNDLDKIIIWNTEFDTLINVTHKQVSYLDPDPRPDSDTQTITYEINVGKANWTYVEIQDMHPDETVKIKDKSGNELSSTKIKRDNNKIYFLDNTGEKYSIIYSYSEDIPKLEHPDFIPTPGSMINASNPTIWFTYNVTVYITDIQFIRYNDIRSAILYSEDIYDDIETYDSMAFSYTPPDNLEPGKYYIQIAVEDTYGDTDWVEAHYMYEPYFEVEEAETPFTLIMILLGISIGFAVAMIIFMKVKNIDFESYLYVKNRKIIPFFKPVVFGPMKINLPEEGVSKAEFFVNGSLKSTVEKPPFEWNFNEPTFLKSNIETKVYDSEGNENSTGPQTFFVFNIPGFFR